MTGRALAIGVVVIALLAGGIMYYLQVFHYYEDVTLGDPGIAGQTDLRLTPIDGGDAVPVPVDDFAAIDAESSPLRFRACFVMPEPADNYRAAFEAYPEAAPLRTPPWFDCYDAAEIGDALRERRAVPLLGQENIVYGIDRVVVVMSDGRGFAWHQINRCGEVVFDGRPVPEDCPEPPQGTVRD